jgi:UDP-GlcNAc:undecaprenyl-phosphate GlcNAc-1-phosphate transferase
MREYLVTLLLAAVICYVVTPYVRLVAIRLGVVSKIRERDVHTTPTPRWGGVAMWIGMAVTFAIVHHLSLVGKSFTRESIGIFLAATFLVLLGMVDDRFELDALTKLAGQSLAAGILLIYGVQIFWLPINGVITLPPSIGQLLTIIIVLVTINAVNFIDGLDGLVAGVVLIGTSAFFLYAYLITQQTSPTNYFNLASLISAIVVGISLGFLPLNWHKAKIFMGDSGSMLLGLLMATSALAVTGQIDPATVSNRVLAPAFLPLILPLAILVLPLLDLLLAVIRRVRAGESPFKADKSHIHHKLQDLGHSHVGSVLVFYLWTAVISFGGLSLLFIPSREAILIAFLVAIPIFIYTIWPVLNSIRKRVMK